MSVIVNIIFAGDFSDRTGRYSDSLEVSESVKEVHESIKDYLKSKYGIVPPYIMLYKNRHITGVLKKDGHTLVKNGDNFKIMPSISGG